MGKFGSINSQQIATQARAAYLNYDKTKSFEDVGYFLTYYVVSGGVVTQNIYRNNMVDVTNIVVSLDNQLTNRDGTSFPTKISNATYYLDYKDGDFTWGTAHPSGTVGTDYLQVATVTTDGNGNVSTITDNADPRGGFRLKPEYQILEIADSYLTPHNTTYIAPNGVTTGVVVDVSIYTSAILAVEGSSECHGDIYLVSGGVKGDLYQSTPIAKKSAITIELTYISEIVIEIKNDTAIANTVTSEIYLKMG